MWACTAVATAAPWPAGRSSQPRWKMELGDEREHERRGERRRGSRRVQRRRNGLGEASERAGGEGDLRRPEEEEGVGDVVTELLAAPGLVHRTRKSRRSSWQLQGGKGEAVAMATATTMSSDGRDRVAVHERNRGGERERRVRGRAERPTCVFPLRAAVPLLRVAFFFFQDRSSKG